MPDTTVAIIGAGIGGVYLAAELGMLGCKLRLHDLDDGRLAEIRTRGGIDVARVNFGPNTGFAATERVTTDLAAAIDGADVIVVVTGSKRRIHRLLRMPTRCCMSPIASPMLARSTAAKPTNSTPRA